MTLDEIVRDFNPGDTGLLHELNPYQFQASLECDMELIVQAVFEAAVREIHSQIISGE